MRSLSNYVIRVISVMKVKSFIQVAKVIRVLQIIRGVNLKPTCYMPPFMYL